MLRTRALGNCSLCESELLNAKHLAIAFLLVAALLSSAASADTITFGTTAPGLFAGPAVEGDFRIELFNGSLFVDSVNGNPGHEMEGGVATGGGTLRIVRDDLVGGLFTFDEADVQQFGYGAVPVVIEGYLGGALQATDSLVTSATSLVHLTLASTNLSGVAIDELRIVLDASSAPFAWEGVDNVDLTSVPEPTSAALLAVGLIAIKLRSRRGRVRV